MYLANNRGNLHGRVPINSTSEYRRTSRQNRTLNAVVDFRYLAPAKLARDDAHEQMLAEAALRQLVDGNEPMILSLPLMDVVRHQLVGILILLGTRLRGTPAGTTTVPAAVSPGATAA